jgi:hypothetical protein
MTNTRANFDAHMEGIRELIRQRPLRPEWRSPIEASLQMKGGFTSDAFGQKYMQEYIRESLKRLSNSMLRFMNASKLEQR